MDEARLKFSTSEGEQVWFTAGKTELRPSRDTAISLFCPVRRASFTRSLTTSIDPLLHRLRLQVDSLSNFLNFASLASFFNIHTDLSPFETLPPIPDSHRLLQILISHISCSVKISKPYKSRSKRQRPVSLVSLSFVDSCKLIISSVQYISIESDTSSSASILEETTLRGSRFVSKCKIRI